MLICWIIEISFSIIFTRVDMADIRLSDFLAMEPNGDTYMYISANKLKTFVDNKELFIAMMALS